MPAVLENLKRTVLEADEAIGRRLRKDGRGAVCRLLANVERSFAQVRSPYELDQDLRETVDEDGYDFGQTYPTDQIDTLREELEPIIMDDDRAQIRTVDGTEVSRTVLLNGEAEVQRIDGMSALLQHPDVVDTVRAYFGSAFRPARARLIRNHPLPRDKEEIAEEGRFTRWWHLDGLGTGILNPLRLLVLLRDKPDRGATQIVPASETRNLLKQYSYEEIYREERDVPALVEVRQFKGRRGTAALFNARTQLHSGINPKEGDVRDVIVFSLVPTRA